MLRRFTPRGTREKLPFASVTQSGDRRKVGNGTYELQWSLLPSLVELDALTRGAVAFLWEIAAPDMMTWATPNFVARVYF